MSDFSKLLKEISKTTGAIVEQVKDMQTLDIDAIPSGSLALDHALGVGGYPRGRIIEVYGQPSGGKTTLSLLAIAEAQKLGGNALYIDVEHSFSKEWASKLGVNVDTLGVTQPDNGEQALSVAEEAIKSNIVDIIVIDSVAALAPKEELEAELAQAQMGLQARMMSKALRRLTSLMKSDSKAVLIFINQIRSSLAMYGNPNTTSGGKALIFYSSVRVEVSKVSQSEVKDSSGGVVGHTIKAKVVKNKVAPPFREAQVALNFQSGVDRVDELATMGLTKGLIEQSGPMYKFGEKKWKGKVELMEALYNDTALRDALTTAIQATK